MLRQVNRTDLRRQAQLVQQLTKTNRLCVWCESGGGRKVHVGGRHGQKANGEIASCPFLRWQAVLTAVTGWAGCVEQLTRRAKPAQRLSRSCPTRKGLLHNGPQGRRSDVPIAGEEQVNVSPTATAHDNDNDDTRCTVAGEFFEVGTVHETAAAVRGGAMRCKALDSFVGRVYRDD